jgi:hypothetical protein
MSSLPFFVSHFFFNTTGNRYIYILFLPPSPQLHTLAAKVGDDLGVLYILDNTGLSETEMVELEKRIVNNETGNLKELTKDYYFTLWWQGFNWHASSYL